MTTTSHECSACSGRGVRPLGYPNLRPPKCLVCQGAGRLPDQMPARDSVADAETLKLARLHMDYPGWLDFQRAQRAADPRVRAHAAFRACPSLRGE